MDFSKEEGLLDELKMATITSEKYIDFLSTF
jgi:hypothetical protein